MDLFTHLKISDTITRITVPGSVYVYLVCGTQRAALIDTGCGVAGLRDYVASLTDLPLTVVLTHGHFDHAGGVGEFEEAFLSPQDMELAARQNSDTVRGRMLGTLPGIAPECLVPPAPKKGFLALSEGDRFDLGGEELVIHALPGHTRGSVCVEFVEGKKLLLGDACCSATHLDFPESASVEEYLLSVRSFREKLGEPQGACLYSHVHNFGDSRILAEMEQLCGDILDGKPGCALGGGVYMAKPVDEKRRRLDGKIANLIYRSDHIRKEHN